MEFVDERFSSNSPVWLLGLVPSEFTLTADGLLMETGIDTIRFGDIAAPFPEVIMLGAQERGPVSPHNTLDPGTDDLPIDIDVDTLQADDIIDLPPRSLRTDLTEAAGYIIPQSSLLDHAVPDACPTGSPDPLSPSLTLSLRAQLAVTPSPLGNSGRVADLDALGRQTAISKPRRPVGTRQQKRLEWERRKADIYREYMENDQALPVVEDIMERKYGFKASTKMCKSRFTEWGWYKYKTERQRRDPRSAGQELQGKGKSAIAAHRQEPPGNGPTGLLLHVNHRDRQFDIFLRAITDFHKGYAEVDERWRTASRLEYYEDVCFEYDDVVGLAIRHIQEGQHSTGFRILRRLYRDIADDVRSDNFDTAALRMLCLSIPGRLLEHGLYDILRTFLRFIGGLKRHRGPGEGGCRHPLAAAADAALQLLCWGNDLDLEGMGECIRRCGSASLSLSRRLRGGRLDIEQLYMWTDTLTAYMCAPTKTEVQEMAREVDVLSSEAADALGEMHDVTFGIEDRFLYLQYWYDIYLDDYPKRLTSLLAKIRHSTDRWDLKTYIFWLSTFMKEGCNHNGVVAATAPPRSEDGLGEIIQKLEQLEVTDPSDLINLENSLDVAGMHAEAERLRMRMLGSEYYVQLEKESAQEEDEFLADLASGALSFKQFIEEFTTSKGILEV